MDLYHQLINKVVNLRKYTVALKSAITGERVRVYGIILDDVDLLDRTEELCGEDSVLLAEFETIIRYVVSYVDNFPTELPFKDETEYIGGLPQSRFIFKLPPEDEFMRLRAYFILIEDRWGIGGHSIIFGFGHEKDGAAYQDVPCLHSWIRCLQAIEKHILDNQANGYEIQEDGSFAAEKDEEDLVFDIWVNDSVDEDGPLPYIIEDCNKIK